MENAGEAMQLKNPFTNETRNLYLYCYSCFNCGRSDLGLELHHVIGRSSSSPFNAFPICLACHGRACHSQEEEQKYFAINLRFLHSIGYKPTEEDLQFLRENYLRLVTPSLQKWLDSL